MQDEKRLLRFEPLEQRTLLNGTITFSGGILLIAPAAGQTDNATAAAESINIVNGPTVSGFQTTQVNSGSSGAFELVNFANKTTVAVNDVSGADAITLDNPTPAAGLTTLNVNGGSTAGDVVNVQATAAGVSTNFTSGAAATVNVSSNAPTNPGNLARLAGTLSINGGGGGDTASRIAWRTLANVKKRSTSERGSDAILAFRQM